MKKNIVLLFVVTILLLASFFIYKNQIVKKTNSFANNHQQPDVLRLIKTNPDPLENATILPIQDLEFTFNMPIYRSEFKHRFDPDVERTVEVVNGIDFEHGTVMRIKFNKPLGLGGGYTLFVESGTKVNEKLRLGRDYIYHFKTIGYRGV